MHRVDTLSADRPQALPTEPGKGSATFAGWHAAGYVDLLPIIPPGATIDPANDRLARGRGKAPGRRGADGLWTLFPGWQAHNASAEDLAAWQEMGAGIGLRRGLVVPLDLDIYDEPIAARVRAKALEMLGPAPVRVGLAPKCVLLYRAKGEMRAIPPRVTIPSKGPKAHLIEIPMQVVVEGVHALTGKPYSWSERMRLAKLSEITQGDIDRFCDWVVSEFPGASRTGAKDRVSKPLESLAAAPDRIGLLKELLAELPNDKAHFPSRADMISVLFAIKGALQLDPDAAEDLARTWAERWEGGDFDHDTFDREWRSLEPESLGATYLITLADKVMPAKAGEAPWIVRYYFDDIEPEPEGASTPAAARLPMPAPYRHPSAIAIPPREWLYGKHLIRRFVSATVAPGGVGKSSLSLVEALAIASGKSLLGVQPRGTHRVWLWNGEDPLDELERRVAAAMMHYQLAPADIGDRLFLTSGRDRPIRIAGQVQGAIKQNDDLVDALVGDLVSLKIDAVFIDPFISTHQVPENDNGAIDLVSKAWAQIADRANASVELVHHVRKTGGAEATVEDARGAGALLATARSVRALNRMTEAEAKLLQVGDNFRRFFRIGADPKSNLAPPPATSDTTWFELKSLALGNGTDAYPLGDDVGVVTRFRPSLSGEEVKETGLAIERAAIAQAVLACMNRQSQVPFGEIRTGVTKVLNEAGLTKSQSPSYVTNKVTTPLSGTGVRTVGEGGQVVRVRAEKVGAGEKAPWRIIAEVEKSGDETDESQSVLS